MAKVLIIDIHAEMYRDRLGAEFPDLQFVLAHTAAQAPHGLSDVDVLICFGIAAEDSIFRRAGRLRWVQSLATGVDHFLRCPSLRPETLITSGRGIHGASMREEIVYLMMAVSRGALQAAEDKRTHHWERRLWSTLNGKTAVIVGVGIVGIAIAELLKALGMQVIGVTRTPRAVAAFDDMVPTDRLIDAVRRADYLINVLPAIPENLGLFDGSVFAAMKSTAYFINGGRGQTVDEGALIAALRERRIAGAGLDVFQNAPLPTDSPFWDLPNVFITPNVGGYIVEYEELITPLVIDNMRLFLAGRQSEMANIVAR
ncbi:MAG: D-2-hydroxyacid dehydrogenase [Xanthobacteraceae bacterium]